MLAYQVWECTRSTLPMAATIDSPVEIVCSAGLAFPRPVRHRGRPVGALAVHGQVHVLGQLLGQVLHVHAGAAVDLGRVLPRAQCDLEAVACQVGLAHLVTSWLLPTTVTPPSETTNPRSRSWSLSTPTCAPSGTTTSLSMIAFCTTALAPMTVLSMITERSTRA